MINEVKSEFYRVTFDWSYRTFRPVLDEDVRYDLDRNFGLAKPLLQNWNPHSLSDLTKKPMPHFFTTFSRAIIGVTPLTLAIQGVKRCLGECGELLPVAYEGETFWLFNCLNLQDALDEEESVFTIYPNGRRSADKGVIRGDFTCDKWFFTVPEKCAVTFTTKSFREFYDSHGLSGIEFDPVRVACKKSPESLARSNEGD